MGLYFDRKYQENNLTLYIFLNIQKYYDFFNQSYYFVLL